LIADKQGKFISKMIQFTTVILTMNAFQQEIQIYQQQNNVNDFVSFVGKVETH